MGGSAGKGDLGARIRRLRREQGLTQSELAGKRLSESYVSLIESGRRSPTADVLEYLAGALGCPIEVLIGESQAPDAASAELLIRRGEWETDSGRSAAALEHLTEGVELARRLGLTVLAIRGQVGQAKALERQGDLTGAVALWEELLEASEKDPRNVPAATVTVGLSRCSRELGDLDRAIEVGELFWKNARSESGTDPASHEGAVIVGATLLTAYLELGNQRRSRELAAQLVELAEIVDTPMATGAAYWNAALAAEAEGRVADALHLAERAQSKLAMTEDVRNRARLQVMLGGLHLRTEPPDTGEAKRILTNAVPVLEQFGSVVDVGYCRTELARAHLMTNDFERARAMATANIEDLERAGNEPIELARTLMVLAASFSALRRKDEARTHAQRAAALLQASGATRQAASCWTELAELNADLGDSAAAIEAFRMATSLLGARRTPGSEVSIPGLPETDRPAQAKPIAG